ncbi:thioredoxin-like protein [Schizophyllum amplum]|uniref:Thioredoxin-like protein n=1 Tax=Schizophyllum amplum TaxID=97359 RepID=A0A550CSB3_9AGAR|nr:thioredoxin-like protein [Auriculariopsis ampla]
MADSHAKITSLAARLVDPNNESRRNRDLDDEDDEEAIFAELEAEIENDDDAANRERGMAVLKSEMERIKQMQENRYGQYAEITDEKEVIRATAREPRCVVHFYHSNFKRCAIMDKHLAKLAPKYYNTRFIRVFVENVPWLVERLTVKVLPCVIAFVDGVSKDRLVGFEELGNNDAFDTAALELRLSMTGVLQKPGSGLDPVFKVSSSKSRDNEEVFDLDE